MLLNALLFIVLLQVDRNAVTLSVETIDLLELWIVKRLLGKIHARAIMNLKLLQIFRNDEFIPLPFDAEMIVCSLALYEEIAE
jgi:hypothetical protein